MAQQVHTIHGALEWVLKKVSELEKGRDELMTRNDNLRKKVGELEQTKTSLVLKVDELQGKNKQLQNVIDDLKGSKTVEPTHRNILYSEEQNKKRLSVFREPKRGADEVGSFVFGECFAVCDWKEEGQDVWLQICGGDHTDQWVLAVDEGTVNCVDMTKYDRGKYRTRIQRSEYRGQNFPRKMYTEGFAGSSSNSICLVSASGDSFWREVNIEMLLRGIATATVFEEAWGGDETFTSWVAYYAVNCVQYGQLRTPLQKRLKVTVKPTSRWRQYQPGNSLGPDLATVRGDIGKAQYKECDWLKSMNDKLHVKWSDVEFLTSFAFLRLHCAWTYDDCKEAAKERFMWVLENLFGGTYHDKAMYELDRAYWLLDEAFDGCCVTEEAARTRTYTELWRLAMCGTRLEVPPSLRTAGAAPLAWGELGPALGVDAAVGLAAGGFHSLALSTAGTLHAWGLDKEEQCSVPTLPPGESWAAVSAGWEHTLALTTAGALRTCGRNTEGQCSPPTLEYGDYWIVVSAGGNHSLGLTASGTLHAWGCNKMGQCNVPALPASERWAAVSAGDSHNLALTVAGELYCWGDHSTGGRHNIDKPDLEHGERWAAISAGRRHNLGLTVAGKLHAWGTNGFNQCSGVPELAPGEHWTAVSAGRFHSLGLTSAGVLHAWGKKDAGQLNVPEGHRWLAVSAGGWHSLGLTSAGEVLTWGDDSNGQVSRVPSSLTRA